MKSLKYLLCLTVLFACKEPDSKSEKNSVLASSDADTTQVAEKAPGNSSLDLDSPDISEQYFKENISCMIKDFPGELMPVGIGEMYILFAMENPDTKKAMLVGISEHGSYTNFQFLTEIDKNVNPAIVKCSFQDGKVFISSGENLVIAYKWSKEKLSYLGIDSDTGQSVVEDDTELAAKQRQEEDNIAYNQLGKYDGTYNGSIESKEASATLELKYSGDRVFKYKLVFSGNCKESLSGELFMDRTMHGMTTVDDCVLHFNFDDSSAGNFNVEVDYEEGCNKIKSGCPFSGKYLKR